MKNVEKSYGDDRFYVSETENSVLIYDSETGYVHFLEEKQKKDDLICDIKKMEKRPSSFVKIEQDTVKINLANVCNLNCSYCFRDKVHKVETDVEMAKQIIDFVVDNLRPGAEYYAFSMNLTSESMVELDKLLKIKEYLDYKLSPSFTESQFKNLDEVKRYLECFPNDFIKYSPCSLTIKEGVEILNGILDRKDLSSFFPLPPGMMLPEWEANEIKKVNELSGYKLRLCNLRFLEAIFPETFVRKAGYAMTVCTNGTLYSEKIVEFLKGNGISNLEISLDGPKDVHDLHRKDYAGKGSYDVISENIRKFQAAGFTVSLAAVMTPDFPNPLDIAEHLRTFNPSSIALNPVRAGNPHSFTESSMKKLLEGYEELYEKLFRDVLKNDYSLVNLLKNDNSFIGISSILNKNRITKRCNWNESLIFDGKGDIYPCDYFIGNAEFKRGSIASTEIKDIEENKIQVEQRGDCRDCWCRYMCGGTCFHNSYKNTGCITDIDKVECMFTKGIRTMCLLFVQRILENGIDIGDFAKKAGLSYGKNIEFGKKFVVKNAILLKFEGTLTKFELKFREFFEKMQKIGVKINPKFYTCVNEIQQLKRGTVIRGTAIVPLDDDPKKLAGEKYFVLSNFDFGQCFGGTCSSSEESVEEMKSVILKQVQEFHVPVINAIWYKGTLDAFLGYSDEDVDVFIQRKPGVF